MLVAFSVDRDNENSRIDARFGRCPFFALVDEPDGKIEYLANPAAGAAVGAGTGAAQMLVDQGVMAVVTGQVGPKALEILTAMQISIFLVPPECDFAVALQLYREGKLRQFTIQTF